VIGQQRHVLRSFPETRDLDSDRSPGRSPGALDAIESIPFQRGLLTAEDESRLVPGPVSLLALPSDQAIPNLVGEELDSVDVEGPVSDCRQFATCAAVEQLASDCGPRYGVSVEGHERPVSPTGQFVDPPCEDFLADAPLSAQENRQRRIGDLQQTLASCDDALVHAEQEIRMAAHLPV
jgi:hypothetical protein